MSKPEFIVRLSERTPNGTIKTSSVQTAKSVLLNRGFLLLPSDTCYSIAASFQFRTLNKDINLLLNRSVGDPISTAFPNFKTIEDWIELNITARRLLEYFTPGPITVICKARLKLGSEFTQRKVRSSDGTIGVRIPDSFIEREIAACTDFPITTTAVRDLQTGEIVQNFEKAFEIISDRMELLNNPEWGAIQGDKFYNKHSTIIRVTDEPEYIKEERSGDIPFSIIKSILDL